MVFKDYDLLYNPIDDITNGAIRGLNRFEDYIDYSIHLTIISQMGYISVNEEKHWVGNVFTRFLEGDMDTFTTSNNIRNNILSIDPKSFYDLLIMNAIEYTAYKEVILGQKINNNKKETICSLITDKMAQNEYKETLDLVMTNKEYKEILIDVYSNLKYGSEIKDKISMIITDRNGSNTKRAMKCLEFNLGYGTKGAVKKYEL